MSGSEGESFALWELVGLATGSVTCVIYSIANLKFEWLHVDMRASLDPLSNIIKIEYNFNLAGKNLSRNHTSNKVRFHDVGVTANVL